MSAEITPARWVEFLDSEYFNGFVKDGGSAIKFAVPAEGFPAKAVAEAVAGQAARNAFLTIPIDAGDTRVHMIDQIFFRIAGAVDWPTITGRVVSQLAGELGYSVPEESVDSLADELARASGVNSKVIVMELRKRIVDRIFSQKRLAKDFRVAMTQLCLAALTGGQSGQETRKAIIDWITGRNPAISAVKHYQIFNRITRANARYALESLLWWLRFAEVPGVLITLDIGRLALRRNPKDDQLFYSKAALLDAYEVLRQCIDSMDRLTGSVFVVLPAPSFLDESDPRGIFAYDALKARVFDEVRDRRLVNPMATLVRLGEQEEAIQ